LEAKARLSDLWATELPLSLRANLSLMWSRVGQVTGPNNRLEGQPPWTANFGADWPLKGTPLTLGASLNYTPGFEITQIDAQSARQGVKSVLDAYALWRFNPEASARLTLSNAGARRYDTGSTTTLADGSSQASDSSARSYTTVNLRAEIRF
jgi:iron complex outermembrane receptor protein